MGTADAVYQNIDIIETTAPRYIVVLAGDHIYKMDYELMLQQHVEQGADVTVGCLEVPRMEATGFGVMAGRRHRPHHRLRREAGRPARHARTSRTSRWPAWASTSSRRDSCSTSCGATPQDPTSQHDFGKDIIPWLVKQRQGGRPPLRALAACAPPREAVPYWRDVGTVDAYFAANIDLTEVVPDLDLYDRAWPIWTYSEINAPAKFVHDVRRAARRGDLVAGLRRLHRLRRLRPRRSLLFTGVRMHSYPARRARWSCRRSRSAAARGCAT